MDGRLRVGGQDGIKSRSTITAITGLIPGSPMVPAIDAPPRGKRHANQGLRGGGQGQNRTADTRIFSAADAGAPQLGRAEDPREAAARVLGMATGERPGRYITT